MRNHAYLTTILTLVVVVLLWELVVRLFGVPSYLLPTPSSVYFELVRKMPLLPPHIGVTLYEVILAFIIAGTAGVVVAAALAYSPLFLALLFPLLVAVQSVPKMALAPLIFLWLGHGIFPKLVFATLIAFFPIFINTLSGLQSTDGDMIDLARSLGASRWQTFVKIRFPNALPYIFAGLKTGCTLAVVGAVAAEFVDGSIGLGYLTLLSQTDVNTPLMFSALFLLAVFSLLFFGAVTLVERRVLHWHVSEQTELKVVEDERF